MESVLINGLKEGTISTLVVILILGYLVVIRILESKERSKQGKLTSELATAIVDMRDLLRTVTTDIILSDKDKCRICIDSSLNAMGKHLIAYAIQTIVNNNIHENKKAIHDNIRRSVNAEFYKVYMNISMYNINGVNPTTYFKAEWKEEIAQAILDCIYYESVSKEYRILNLCNTINVKINDYCIYISNNVF